MISVYILSPCNDSINNTTNSLIEFSVTSVQSFLPYMGNLADNIVKADRP